MTGLQVLCAVSQSGPSTPDLNPGRVQSTRFRRDFPFLSRAAWRGPAAADPHAGRRRHSCSGVFMLVSIGVGFAVATLCATGLLFVVQVVEDFRSV